jgi:prepilin-type N-terminal cleavage/methylation domain-containing protein
MRGRGLALYSEKKRRGGYSLTELLVVVAIALVLMGIGLPAFMRAYRAYQLTNAAQQLADILRYTRYEAIRLNKNVNCRMQPSMSDPTMTSAWADSNGNNTLDPTEKTILLGNAGNWTSQGSVPGATALLGTALIPAGGTVVAAPSTAVVQFDSRGAVSPPNPTVFYLSSSVAPEAGYRGVVLMPAGSVQIWSGDGTGNWKLLH